MKGKNGQFLERSIAQALSFLKDSVFADEYALKKGFLQARDPRIKLISILLLLLSVLLAQKIIFLLGVYILCLILAYISSVNLWFFLRRTWFFIPIFSLFIVVPSLFSAFTPGEQLLSFKLAGFDFVITKQGLTGASFFFMRVLTSVSLGVLLALTTRHYTLLRVLRVFRIPQIFVMTLGMCYRYIYLFIEIIQNTCSAIKSRVGRISSIKKGQRVIAFNVANLWQRSYLLHGQVYLAMLSRGYSGEPKTLEEFSADLKDWFFLSAAFTFFILGIWKNYFSN